MSFPAIFKPYFRSLQIPEVTSITLLLFSNYNYQFTYGLVSLHFSEQVPAFCQFFLSPFSYDISLRTHSFVPKQLTAQLIDFDLWMIWNYLTIYFDNLYLYSLC